MQSIHSILKEHWGYSSFRPLQEDIINSVLNGNDTLALLPTGGGKSICFQVPALAIDGVCLVVSPLIALMKDQVENLRKRNITAFAIFSGMSRKEVENTLKTASSSNCKFLYVSPERLETKLFQEYLPSLGISLLAIDEAHCISQWGYDFRPPYLRIAETRQELPGVPVLALTASATAHVQKDICDKLSFSNPSIFRQSFERPNLSYSSFHTDSKINRIIDILNKVQGTSIVYCRSRKRTKEFSDLLNMHGINADFYHAGLSQQQRNDKQEAWISNNIRVIVCTNAFGMGIDKPDVRLVIHADVPDCLENYYQEAGRAGRDGKKSYAVLLHNDRDIDELKAQPDIRYPLLADIRIVYKQLMNYLQIPSGSGEGLYIDFDLQSFIKQSGLKSALVLASLKILELEEKIVVNEQAYVPSKVEFICSREKLEELERKNSSLEAISKTLLRTYQGIYDQPVAISENMVAHQMKSSAAKVKEQLSHLHNAAIIRYTPQKEDPNIYFIVNRVAAENLNIDLDRYHKRKKLYSDRIDQMLKFIAGSTCRSRFISNYFGDADTRDCGNCDICLERKKTPLTAEEFNKIHLAILDALKIKSPANKKVILEQNRSFRKDKVVEVLNFLHAENKISIDSKGDVKLA